MAFYGFEWHSSSLRIHMWDNATTTWYCRTVNSESFYIPVYQWASSKSSLGDLNHWHVAESSQTTEIGWSLWKKYIIFQEQLLNTMSTTECVFSYSPIYVQWKESLKAGLLECILAIKKIQDASGLWGTWHGAKKSPCLSGGGMLCTSTSSSSFHPSFLKERGERWGTAFWCPYEVDLEEREKRQSYVGQGGEKEAVGMWSGMQRGHLWRG